jgi:hypothetical protein
VDEGKVLALLVGETGLRRNDRHGGGLMIKGSRRSES